MEQYDYQLLKSVGTDVLINAQVEIRRPNLVTIGDHVAIDFGACITTAAEIGDYVHISPHVTVIGGGAAMLIMRHFTNLAAGCRVVCGSDRFLGEGLIGSAAIPDQYKDKMKLAPIVLENFANVGSNAIIMPGVTLAVGSVVGAGALVTKNTQPWTIYAGTPARAVRARPKDTMIRYARAMGYDLA